MKKTIIFLLIILLTMSFANATTTDITANRDTEVKRDAPGDNFGTANSMSLGLYMGSVNNERYILIGWDETEIPVGSVITSATAYIYQGGDGGGIAFDANVHRKDYAWAEGTVTWSTQGTPGTAITSFSSTSAGWKSFDLTNTFIGWYNGTYTNNGLQISNDAADSENSDSYTSREGTNKPYLRIVYDLPPSPPVPINVASTTGHFWVNTTWDVGTGVVTDSYNISQNGTWVNNTNNTFVFSNVGVRGWSNVTIYSYNTTYSTLSLSSVSLNTQVPNNIPTVATSFTNLGNNLIDHTPTITWTKGTDADSDTVTTYIYVGTTATPTTVEVSTTDETYDLGTNITFEDGITYYYRLRSWDGYEFSDYTTADEFNLNDKPIITNVTISPDPTAVENDLTANNDTATDTDGDSITLYYKWYKNTVLQPLLTTSTVGSANTADGEYWKVGIIPNDNYENGTEVQSQTVLIGSSNSAPSLTSVFANITYPMKKYVNFTITTTGATDANGNSYKLEIGSATGLSDIGIGDYFLDGNQANITISMPYSDGLSHVLYARLNDSNLTSQERTLIIESDTTLPVLNSESISATTGTQGATFGITINTTSVNSTISTVTMHVSRPDATSANWTLTNTVNDTWYYSYTPTSDIGPYTIDYFTITDASDNIKTATSALSFTVTAAVTTGTGGDGGGGGGGGGGTTIINATLGDLTLTPSRLDTYALYGGFGAERVLEYRFRANRAVNGCIIEPNSNIRCEVTDGYIVDVFMTVNGSTESYVGKLTVTDNDDYVATADLIVRIVDLGASIDIVEIPIGEASALTLNPFFASEDGILTGVRLWFVALIVILFVFFLFRSDLLQM